ncbi:hypothetical protein MHH81_20575 [Psychrobacillus sp. FSL H8-0484]|uniref:hypothetical protein n=1 Tax=Psychrobacillus sp. FSL H8-0484 TaxID=2921390 RepID=UPI0030FC7767
MALNELKKEDFYFVKEVALRGTTPSKINMFLIGATIYSFLTIAVSTYAVILRN